MPDIATLGININFQNVVEADKALQSLTTTGTRAQQTFGGFTTATKSSTAATVQQVQAHVSASGATERHAMNINRLERAMETASVRILGANDVLALFAASMGKFAVGDMGLIGVLAGVYALTEAWKKFREEANQAKELMKEMAKLEGGFSPAAKLGRRDDLLSQESALAARVRGAQDARGTAFHGTPIGAVLDLVNYFQTNDLTNQLTEIRSRLAELDKAIAKFTRDLQDEASDKRRFATQRLAVSATFNAAELAKVRDFTNPNAGIDETAFAEKQKASFDFQVAATKAMREYAGDALKAKWAALRVDRDDAIALADQTAEFQKQLIAAKEKAGALHSLASFGIGLAAQNAGPFGGLVQGVGSNLLMGNMWGAAAAGVTGLVDGIINMGAESARAAEQFRLWQVQFASFSDSLSLSLGDITKSEFDIREFQRQVEEQRRALIEMNTVRTVDEEKSRLLHGIYFKYGLSEEGQRLLDELNEKERRRIEQLKKEGDAIERINTAVRNAPSGFFIERYLGQLGGLPGVQQYNGVLTKTASLQGSGGARTSIVLQPGAIQVNGNQSPLRIAQDVVRGLRQYAASVNGSGMSLSQAMDMIN